MRILLAEDDGPLASFLSKGLQAENYLVDVAAGGDEAHTMLTERGYDLIILDLNPPKLDGLQILCKVRNIGGISTPILVLTQRSDIPAISGTTPILMSRA